MHVPMFSQLQEIVEVQSAVASLHWVIGYHHAESSSDDFLWM